MPTFTRHFMKKKNKAKSCRRDLSPMGKKKNREHAVLYNENVGRLNEFPIPVHSGEKNETRPKKRTTQRAGTGRVAVARVAVFNNFHYEFLRLFRT